MLGALGIFLVLVLYKLLKHVNEHLAKLMVALMLMGVSIAMFAEVFNFASLMILKGEVLTTFETEQLQDLALLCRKIFGYGMTAAGIFYGLWLFPFGQLVYKSGFIPRILGVLLIIGSIGYVFESLQFMLFPDYGGFVSEYAAIVYGIGEPLMILWLLIKGVKSGTQAK